MKNWSVIVIAGVFALLFAPSVWAGPSDIDCSALDAYTPCRVADAGARSAEDHAFRHYDLLRVTATYGLYGHDKSIELLSAPYGTHILRLRDPSDVGLGMQVELDDPSSDSLLNIWHDFQARLAAIDFAARKAAIKGMAPCPDGATLQIDLAEKGVARHILIDGCLTPEMDGFVEAFAARAFDLVPQCRGFHLWPTPYCLRLKGNYDEAVQVARNWDRSSLTDPMSFDGRSDGVMVTGRVIRIDNVKEGNSFRTFFYAAPFSQFWRKTPEGRFLPETRKVGLEVQVDQLF